MKNILITLCLLVFSSFDLSAQNDVLRRVSNSLEMKPYTTGYINTQGDTIIPIGKYIYCYTKEFDKLAIVSSKDFPGIIGINRDEKKLFDVVIYDNGPDFVKEGLFRIEKNGKIGFANTDGEVVIKPQFDSASPFFDGLAAICIGCKVKKVHEMEIAEGGKWGYIDKSGKIVIKPQFDRVFRFENEKAKVVKEGNTFFIDKNGRRIIE